MLGREIHVRPLASGDCDPCRGHGREQPDDRRPDLGTVLPTPNHPEYPSAHNCATAGFGAAMAELAGSRRIELDVDSTVTGTTHRFDHVNDLEREIVNARVWIGYHWRTSDEVGYQLGERVARWTLQRYFGEND